MTGLPDARTSGGMVPDDDDRDHWQEYKDGLIMGYINPDGSQREPDEPDWETLADNAADPCAGPGPLLDRDDPPYLGEAPF